MNHQRERRDPADVVAAANRNNELQRQLDEAIEWFAQGNRGIPLREILRQERERRAS